MNASICRAFTVNDSRPTSYSRPCLYPATFRPSLHHFQWPASSKLKCVFFFLIFFSYSMFSFSFPSYRSFFKFLIRTREKFSFFLYMRMTKKSFPIRWQWGIRPCFERSHRLMFYHCYVTPTTESSAQRERNLDHSATLPVIN